MLNELQDVSYKQTKSPVKSSTCFTGSGALRLKLDPQAVGNAVDEREIRRDTTDVMYRQIVKAGMPQPLHVRLADGGRRGG